MILLTARGEESDRLVGLRRGADDYVVKPFSPAELVARVEAVMRRVCRPDGGGRGEPPIEHGPLRVEPATRRVFLDGEEISLTQREFDLLAYLAAHPGRVFSRDQLMEAVWEYPFFTDTSTVTVHIRRLRAKLERRPGRAALHRDGLGHRLQVAAVKRAAVIAVAAFVAGRRRGRRSRTGWACAQMVLVALAVAAARWRRRLRFASRWRSARGARSRRHAASSSPPPRTTCARRWPRCACWSSRSTMGWSTGETRDRYLAEIRTHVGVLSDLVDDLFELSRIEAGESPGRCARSSWAS